MTMGEDGTGEIGFCQGIVSCGDTWWKLVADRD